MTHKKKVLTRKEMAKKILASLSMEFHKEHKPRVEGRFISVDRGDGRRMFAGFVLPHDNRTDLERVADAAKED